MPFQNGIFQFQCRVYYEDTDTAGVVYYANYLKFAERARTEALRAIGIEQHRLIEEQQLGFVVRECHAKFLSPARLDDLLTTETRLHDISKASLDMQQDIRRGVKTLCTLRVQLAVVGKGMKPARLPAPIADALRARFELAD